MNCNLYWRKRIHVCYAVVSEGVNLSGYLPNEGCSTRLVIGCAECPKCLKQSGQCQSTNSKTSVWKVRDRIRDSTLNVMSLCLPPQAAAAAGRLQLLPDVARYINAFILIISITVIWRACELTRV